MPNQEKRAEDDFSRYGKEIASDPRAVAGIFMHETLNMMNTVITAILVDPVFKKLKQEDEARSPQERKAFLSDLDLSDKGTEIIVNHLSETGGLDYRIIERLLYALPQSLQPKITQFRRAQTTNDPRAHWLGGQVFYECLLAELDFFKLINQLDISEESERVSFILEDWHEKIKAQADLKLIQLSQKAKGQPPSTQLALMEMDEEARRLLSSKGRVIYSNFTGAFFLYRQSGQSEKARKTARLFFDLLSTNDPDSEVLERLETFNKEFKEFLRGLGLSMKS